MSGPDLLTAESAPPLWYSTNLVGVPTAVLAGTRFQHHPVPLRLAGVRATHSGLFRLLETACSLGQAREVFAHYMRLAFGLGAPDVRPGATHRHRRTSYLKLLQGWGMDANGAAGAVLKSWVESRFGIAPTFHGAPLARFPSEAWIRYMQEKASPRWNNNAIWQQIDLLYEYCQWAQRALGLLPLAGQPPQQGKDSCVLLWRGCSRADEQVVAGSLRERRCTVRLNNLVSFSVSAEEAGCFGDWVLQAWIPRSKLLLVPGLLERDVLQGEGEVLVIGGDYDVETRYG